MPSVVEGLSLAVLEALDAGLPCVLTRVGDAEFLLGEQASVEGQAPGILIDGPAIDPHAANWMTLRELAGVDHPPHAARLAQALDAVLDDLPRFRAGAAARAAEVAEELDVRTMCRRPASPYLAVAARAASRRALMLESELARERRQSSALIETFAAMPEQIGTQLSDQISHRILPEIAASRRLASETH